MTSAWLNTGSNPLDINRLKFRVVLHLTIIEIATYLKPSKLFLFAPIVECSNKNNNNNCQKDCNSFNPVSMALAII